MRIEISETEILDAFDDWRDEWIQESAVEPELYQVWREAWIRGMRFSPLQRRATKIRNALHELLIDADDLVEDVLLSNDPEIKNLCDKIADAA